MQPPSRSSNASFPYRNDSQPCGFRSDKRYHARTTIKEMREHPKRESLRIAAVEGLKVINQRGETVLVVDLPLLVNEGHLRLSRA